jgi:hypothetical protein
MRMDIIPIVVGVLQTKGLWARFARIAVFPTPVSPTIITFAVLDKKESSLCLKSIYFLESGQGSK